MKREYYQDIGYKPFLFYIIFGVSGEDLEVSQKRHKVDELPDGLNLQTLTREQHGDYMDGFLTGPMGKVLGEANPDLLMRCKKAKECVILQGSVVNDRAVGDLWGTLIFTRPLVAKRPLGYLCCEVDEHGN